MAAAMLWLTIRNPQLKGGTTPAGHPRAAREAAVLEARGKTAIRIESFFRKGDFDTRSYLKKFFNDFNDDLLLSLTHKLFRGRF
jgi:hypothetical protein